MSYSKLLKEIMYDEDNISYTEKGIKPLFSAPETAQIIIIAQAPGIRAQELGIFLFCHQATVQPYLSAPPHP